MFEEDREKEDRLDHDQRGFLAQGGSRRNIGWRVGKSQALHRACDLQEQARQEPGCNEQRCEVSYAALDTLIDHIDRHRDRETDQARCVGTGQGDGVFIGPGIGDPLFADLCGVRPDLDRVVDDEADLADFRVQTAIIRQHFVEAVEVAQPQVKIDDIGEALGQGAGRCLGLALDAVGIEVDQSADHETGHDQERHRISDLQPRPTRLGKIRCGHHDTDGEQGRKPGDRKKERRKASVQTLIGGVGRRRYDQAADRLEPGT